MMNESEREVLLDIFENTEALEKIEIVCDPLNRDVTIHYLHMDYEWFQELIKAKNDLDPGPKNCPLLQICTKPSLKPA